MFGSSGSFGSVWFFVFFRYVVVSFRYLVWFCSNYNFKERRACSWFFPNYLIEFSGSSGYLGSFGSFGSFSYFGSFGSCVVVAD